MLMLHAGDMTYAAVRWPYKLGSASKSTARRNTYSAPFIAHASGRSWRRLRRRRTGSPVTNNVAAPDESTRSMRIGW